MKSLLVVLAVVASLIPSLTSAQERVTVDVDYIGGDLINGFSYPLHTSLQSGKQYGTDGIGLAVKVTVIKGVRIGYRFEQSQLHKATNFYDNTTAEKMFRHQTDEDTLFHDGRSTYQEFFGSIALPKTHGHMLIVGFSKNDMMRNSQWNEQGGTGAFTLESHFKGLVLGGGGKQTVRRLSLDYAAQIYRQSGTEAFVPAASLDATGYELRGSATWSVAKHVGLTGGYQFRRMGTDISATGTDGRPWPLHENQDSKSVLVGTRISF